MDHRHVSRTVFRGALVEVTDFECHDDDTRFGPEEVAHDTHAAFVRAGAFERCVAGRPGLVDANQVAFFHAGEPYRVRHPLHGGDRCTVLTPRGDVLRDLLRAADPSAGEADEPRFGTPRAACDAATFLLHEALLRHLHGPHVDALAVEEACLALGGCAAHAAQAATGRDAAGSRRSSGGPAGTRRRHAELAEAARRLLGDRLAEPLALDDLAGVLGCSPFHLARVFRDCAGQPLHRYRMRLRLRAALRPIADGEGLTGVALAHGFSSHAHLDDSFRQEFGTTPSAFRRDVNAARLRRLSKMLEA